MIRLAVLSLSLAVAGLVPGEAAAETPRQLSGSDISAVTSKSLGALRACYARHAPKTRKATGKVRFDLIIHRDGSPFRLGVDTPGVKSSKLDRCLTGVAQTWRFPRRKGFTHTVVPFLFLRTHVDGAGPQYSCWKSDGCKTRDRAPSSARDESPRMSKQAD